MGKPIFRFAPSPNGYLHLGHALSALINRQMADESSGALFLRVDNTDLTRARPEFEAAIVEDLMWLGMEFDGEIRRQSDNIAACQSRNAPNVWTLLRVCFAHGLPMLLWRSSRIGCGPRQAVAGRSNLRSAPSAIRLT